MTATLSEREALTNEEGDRVRILPLVRPEVFHGFSPVFIRKMSDKDVFHFVHQLDGFVRAVEVGALHHLEIDMENLFSSHLKP